MIKSYLTLEKSAFKIPSAVKQVENFQRPHLQIYDPLKLQKRVHSMNTVFGDIDDHRDLQPQSLAQTKTIECKDSDKIPPKLGAVFESSNTSPLLQRFQNSPTPGEHIVQHPFPGSVIQIRLTQYQGKEPKIRISKQLLESINLSANRSSPLSNLISEDILEKLQNTRKSLRNLSLASSSTLSTQNDGNQSQRTQEECLGKRKRVFLGTSRPVQDVDHHSQCVASNGAHSIFSRSLILEKNDLQKYQIKEQKGNMSSARMFGNKRRFSLLDDSESQSEEFFSPLDDPNHGFIHNDWNCAGDLIAQNQLIQSSNQDGNDQYEKFEVPEEIKIESTEKRAVNESDVEEDHLIILAIIHKSLSKKSSEKALDRQDVIIKTIFRIFRSFYKWKLDETQGKRRKKKPRPDILQSLDNTSKILFKSFNVPPQITINSLSNYLGALIMPKCIQQMQIQDDSCGKMMRMIDDVSTSSKNSDNSNTINNDKENLCMESREERFKQIKRIAEETQSVLYKYNKRNLKNFFKSQENVCMIDYFLRQSLKVFKNYNALMSTQELQTFKPGKSFESNRNSSAFILGEISKHQSFSSSLIDSSEISLSKNNQKGFQKVSKGSMRSLDYDSPVSETLIQSQTIELFIEESQKLYQQVQFHQIFPQVNTERDKKKTRSRGNTRGSQTILTTHRK